MIHIRFCSHMLYYFSYIFLNFDKLIILKFLFVPFFINMKGDAWSDIREEFKKRATFRLKEQLIDDDIINDIFAHRLSLKILHFDHLTGAPTQVVSQVTLTAYVDNFDYFYQVIISCVNYFFWFLCFIQISSEMLLLFQFFNRHRKSFLLLATFFFTYYKLPSIKSSSLNYWNQLNYKLMEFIVITFQTDWHYFF